MNGRGGDPVADVCYACNGHSLYPVKDSPQADALYIDFLRDQMRIRALGQLAGKHQLDIGCRPVDMLAPVNPYAVRVAVIMYQRHRVGALHRIGKEQRVNADPDIARPVKPYDGIAVRLVRGEVIVLDYGVPDAVTV